MPNRDFAVYDVFTTERLAGNALAVVFDSAGLDGGSMQRIAREFNLSETTFVLPPRDPRHRAAIRIFNPMHELPFAGHPTVGSAIAIMERSGQAAAGTFVLEEEIGPVRCVMSMEDAGLFAEFDLPSLPQPRPFSHEPDVVAAAIGLPPSQIGFDNHTVTHYSAGVPYVLIPVTGLGAAGAAGLDMRRWVDLTGPAEALAPAAFVYCRETVGRGIQFHARMFAGHLGIAEDPATGSAIAALAGAIIRFDGPTEGTRRYAIEQGVEMGRPSLIRLELDVTGGTLTAARIGGHAMKVSQGSLLV